MCESQRIHNLKGTFIVNWTIQNFASIGQGNYIRSKSFAVSNMAKNNLWELQVYPKGTNSVKQKVFCCLKFIGMGIIDIQIMFKIICDGKNYSNKYEYSSFKNGSFYFCEMMSEKELTERILGPDLSIQCFMKGYQRFGSQLQDNSLITSLEFIRGSCNAIVEYFEEDPRCQRQLMYTNFCTIDFTIYFSVSDINVKVKVWPFVGCPFNTLSVELDIVLLSNTLSDFIKRSAVYPVKSEVVIFQFFPFTTLLTLDRHANMLLQNNNICFKLSCKALTMFTS